MHCRRKSWPGPGAFPTVRSSRAPWWRPRRKPAPGAICKERVITGFAQLFSATRSALAGAEAQPEVRFTVASQGKEGLHREVNIRDFSVEVDEPPALGGKDRAPNPMEYALAALATCQEITYRLHADALGIPLTDVSVELDRPRTAARAAGAPRRAHRQTRRHRSCARFRTARGCNTRPAGRYP